MGIISIEKINFRQNYHVIINSKIENLYSDLQCLIIIFLFADFLIIFEIFSPFMFLIFLKMFKIQKTNQ